MTIRADKSARRTVEILVVNISCVTTLSALSQQRAEADQACRLTRIAVVSGGIRPKGIRASQQTLVAMKIEISSKGRHSTSKAIRGRVNTSQTLHGA